MTSALVLSMLVPSLPAQPAKEPDLRCELFGHYTGNAISPSFQLTIGGPPKREWTYSYSDDMFGRQKPPRATEYRGTYEIDGDLAVFAGELTGEKPRAIRFGLNFGFPDGKVSFDRLFPNAKGEFAYARKWFRQKGKEWQPAEEWRFTMALPAGALPETIEIPWKGQLVRWDADGKKTEEPIDVKLRYKASGSGWYAAEKPDVRVPGELILEWVGKKVVAITWANRHIGDLRGFVPTFGEPAKPQ